MAEILVTSPVIQKTRPTGVWILTIYAMIFAGIAPVLLSLFLLASGNAAGNVAGILFSLPVSIGVIASAIGAWKGKDNARKSLIFLVTLYYVLLAINNFILINSGQAPDEQLARLWGRVLRGFINPAIYIWYFTKTTTRDFYN